MAQLLTALTQIFRGKGGGRVKPEQFLNLPADANISDTDNRIAPDGMYDNVLNSYMKL